MTLQQERGRKGEDLAITYLQNIGYRIEERNFRSGRSEIDIIATFENTLVFLEVKARTSIKFGNPESFVDEAKAAKVIEGAESYIAHINWNGPIRFDIISIIYNSKEPEIRHFKDAFY
ncbi:MAG: YraN family protein [Cyclobacteriaceae bacterium]|nr:YraN family protein [Cyclobacteriaceae bacterium]